MSTQSSINSRRQRTNQAQAISASQREGACLLIRPCEVLTFTVRPDPSTSSGQGTQRVSKGLIASLRFDTSGRTDKEPRPKGRGIGIPETMARGTPQAAGNLPAMIKTSSSLINSPHAGHLSATTPFGLSLSKPGCTVTPLRPFDKLRTGQAQVERLRDVVCAWPHFRYLAPPSMGSTVLMI